MLLKKKTINLRNTSFKTSLALFTLYVKKIWERSEFLHLPIINSDSKIREISVAKDPAGEDNTLKQP